MVKCNGINYSRKTWNEMQRDAYDPDENPKTYYCELCGHRHRFKSKVGFLHNPDITLEVKSRLSESWGRTLRKYYEQGVNNG